MLAALRSAEIVGTVALGAEGALGADELWHNAAVIAARLPAPSPGSMVTFAFGHDRAAFAAALLGTWFAGHGAALPENDRRDYVVPVMNLPESVAFLHDTGVGRGIDVSRLLAGEQRAVALPDLPGLPGLPEDPERVVLATHTAASDGQTQVQSWTASQLLAVVDGIVESLQLAAGAVVAHGFTPAFLPAVLAGLLAPLRAGGSFVLGRLATAEELASAARTSDASVVLCTPRQLRALASLPSGALQSVDLVVCGGGLPVSAAEALREHHDVAVGAILEGEPDPAEECVEQLLAIDGIEDAAVARLQGDSAALVAVVGSESRLLSARSVAAAVFDENVELLVRTVQDLPHGPNDRVPFGDLCARFGRGRDGMPVTRELEWRALPADDDGVQRYQTRIPDRFTFFEGHFTTYPVLAGGVQLQELVLPCVRVAEPRIGALQRLDAIKFLARIAPADEVEVSIRVDDDASRVQCEIWCGDTRCTTGKLSFTSANETE